LLTYKVPPEPATKRIALWRRLKGMGAIYLQNGVCLLPKTDDHVRRRKMLENDVSGMGDESVILETVALDRAQEDKVGHPLQGGSRRSEPRVPGTVRD
jgi:hypothetical protein